MSDDFIINCSFALLSHSPCVLHVSLFWLSVSLHIHTFFPFPWPIHPRSKVTWTKVANKKSVLPFWDTVNLSHCLLDDISCMTHNGKSKTVAICMAIAATSHHHHRSIVSKKSEQMVNPEKCVRISVEISQFAVCERHSKQSAATSSSPSDASERGTKKSEKINRTSPQFITINSFSERQPDAIE